MNGSSAGACKSLVKELLQYVSRAYKFTFVEEKGGQGWSLGDDGELLELNSKSTRFLNFLSRSVHTLVSLWSLTPKSNRGVEASCVQAITFGQERCC